MGVNIATMDIIPATMGLVPQEINRLFETIYDCKPKVTRYTNELKTYIATKMMNAVEPTIRCFL